MQDARARLTLTKPVNPSPSNLILHGLENTCKSTLVRRILALSTVSHAIVQSQECITGRHLLESIVAACIKSLDTTADVHVDYSRYGRCENLAALAVHLQRLLDDVPKFVLVLDLSLIHI